MEAEGCRVVFPADRLSVMGMSEVVRHLPALWYVRERIHRRLVEHRPDVFVGIDAPDFNLGLERRLKRAGVSTVHYVSPSVWAWRRYRVHRIRRATDVMLTLLPFEAQFYHHHGVCARFVGHPAADRIAPQADVSAARQSLGLPPGEPTVALLPGSRMNEVRRLMPVFLGAALWCLERLPGVRFVLPVASAALLGPIRSAVLRDAPTLPLTLVEGRSGEAMTASNVVLTASGTATLEAMLIPRPMVVAYRLSPLTYRAARLLVKVPHISLPNLIAGRSLVPEFLQERASAEALGSAVLHYFDHPEAVQALLPEFIRARRLLQRDADAGAAEAVLDLIAARQVGQRVGGH